MLFENIADIARRVNNKRFSRYTFNYINVVILILVLSVLQLNVLQS